MIQSRSVALMMLLFAGTTAFALDPPIPEQFNFKFDGVPIWVAASSAIAADGLARPGILRPEEREELLDLRQRQAARPERQIEGHSSRRCDVNFFASIDDADVYPAATLEALAVFAATRSVISGVVTASAVGLHGGKPQTILQVRTDVPAEAGSIVYLMYPHGELRYEGMTVCKDDPAFAAPPSVGDAVTFVAGDAIDSTNTLFVTDGSWIFYEHAGVAVLPLALQSDAALRRIPTARALALFLREERDARRQSRKEER